MRLRITRQLSDCIDGIHLGDFIVGFVYDVGTTLGCYLLSEGAAEPVADESPALVMPLHRVRFRVIRAATTLPTPKVVPMRQPKRVDVAADRAPRRRKRR